MPDGRLNSWKEIAAHLGRGVRTAQRWEREEQLPVHRLPHEKRSSVYAEISELDAWWAARGTSLKVAETDSQKSWHRYRWWLMAGTGALAVAATIFSWRNSNPGEGLVLTRLTDDSGLSTDPAVSPDGKFLAFASDREGGEKLSIWVKRLDGGQPVRLTRSGSNERTPTFSPDGSLVAFESETDGIFVVDLLGGEPRRLATHGRAPRFSPDGKWIAYWQGTVSPPPSSMGAGSVYVVATAGGVPRKVKTDLGAIGHPIWSTDGENLLVYGSRHPEGRFLGDHDWWIVRSEGGSAVNTGCFDLLRKQGFTLSPYDFVPRAELWRADRVIFSGKRGDTQNIWQVELAQSTMRVSGLARRLTSGTAHETRPALLEDGRIVFSSVNTEINIFGLPVAANEFRVTGSIRQLTHGVAGNYYPSLARNILAFTSLRSGNEDIWVKNLETGKELALAASPVPERHPAVSRDGRLVAFNEGGATEGWLKIADVSGNHTELVTTGSAYVWDWFPDGESILFHRIRDGPSPRRILRLDLRTRSESVFLESDEYDVYQAKVSPDGRWVVFEATDRRTRSRSKLFITAIGSREQKSWIDIAPDDSWHDKPRWSPDGNGIYYVSFRDGSLCLWGQRLDPGTKTPMGEPFAVAHFHAVRRSLAAVGFSVLEIDVAPGQIALVLGEQTGNIWTATLP